MLKFIGILDRPTPGSTDPQEVEQRMRIAKQETDAKLGEQAMLASIDGLGLGGFDSGGLGSRGKAKKPSAESLMAELSVRELADTPPLPAG